MAQEGIAGFYFPDGKIPECDGQDQEIQPRAEKHRDPRTPIVC